MRKIALIIILLVLSDSFGYCQGQPLQLTIRSDKKVFAVDEDINLWPMLKNLTSQVIEDVPDLIASSKIILDSKEYNHKYLGDWSVRWREIPPNGSIGFILGLADYEFAKEILTIGKHDIAVKINEVTSNTIQIEVKAEVNGEESQKIFHSLYCQKNEDCKAVIDYCYCEQICLNKFTVKGNCPPRDCNFNIDSQVCYCKNNQCVEGPRE
ncbi:MAG: hypothetical protein AB1629_05740 [Candidatus Omnitrophota bacterium]